MQYGNPDSYPFLTSLLLGLYSLIYNICLLVNNQPFGMDTSYMTHGSYGRNNFPEAKGLVDNANFLFTNKLISRLNADRPILIYQLQSFGSRAIVSSIRPVDHIRSIQTQRADNNSINNFNSKFKKSMICETILHSWNIGPIYYK